jgi:hypothetical protein
MTKTFSNAIGFEEGPRGGCTWFQWLAVGIVGVAFLGLPAGRSHAADERSPLTGARSKEAREAGVVDAGFVVHPNPLERALRWLAAHQMPDGGWSFDHTQCPKCKGQCGNPGELAEARNAATGLALLAFLGAGQTHTYKPCRHKETVKAGLYFLVSHMKVTPQGGSLYEGGGRMYSHGIATIALCEAYVMTADKGLYAPAQQAVNFIAYAQDPVGGGWRYQPRQPGDTSVTGWQLTALRSAQMAGLKVPPVALAKASKFLDSVQANGGANYGYTGPAPHRHATTAIGLLMRVYLGWKRDNPGLQRGVTWLSEQGPSQTNMYYNYYGTQVMHQMGGDAWDKWNAVMRDQLVDSQVQEGHETGSWYFAGAGQGAAKGGRLYHTAMATLILEVYYRHLPIYRVLTPKEERPARKPSSTESGVLPIPERLRRATPPAPADHH